VDIKATYLFYQKRIYVFFYQEGMHYCRLQVIHTVQKQ